MYVPSQTESVLVANSTISIFAAPFSGDKMTPNTIMEETNVVNGQEAGNFDFPTGIN